MKEIILTLGAAKIADFAGCIYVNYLVYMNGGLYGYKSQDLEAIRIKETNRVANLSNIELYVDSVVKAISATPTTPTEEYFKKAYQTWFLKK